MGPDSPARHLEEPVTRDQRLTMADAAATRATSLAREAERYALGEGNSTRATAVAAAADAWATVARIHTAIAALLPETKEG